jgi:signal transduction histidine kinase
MRPPERLDVSFADATNLLIHDLNNFLGHLLANGRFIAESKSEDDVRAAGVDVEAAGLAMKRLLANYWAFACQAPTPSMAHVLLAPLLERVVGELRPIASERLRLLPVMPSLAVVADETLLRRALAVLIENSTLYALPQGRIDVTARLVNGRVQLRVSDDGPAVPDALRPLVFTPDARLHDEAKRMRLGPVFGLPFVKSAVEAMGGTVSLDARSAGESFVVELPGAD